MGWIALALLLPGLALLVALMIYFIVQPRLGHGNDPAEPPAEDVMASEALPIVEVLPEEHS